MPQNIRRISIVENFMFFQVHDHNFGAKIATEQIKNKIKFVYSVHYLHMWMVWSKIIHNCHRIHEEKLQKNCCERHFVAQSILDEHLKFQHDSSNGTPVQSNRAKVVAQTPIQF